MTRISKRQLKEDTFLTTMVQSWEYIREHQNYFFVGLMALVVIIAGATWFNHSKKQASVTANNQFAEATSAFRTGDIRTAEELFRLISDRHPNIREGAFSFYFAGKCALETGRYPEAIESFESYLSKSGKYPMFVDAAREGRAIALENERRHEEAAEAYLALADDIRLHDFMENVYLRRAATNLKQANEIDRAIPVMERLLDLLGGFERRDLEIEIQLLKG